MSTAKELADNLIVRAKSLKKFTVLRDFDQIPLGIVKYDVHHTKGELAKIFVYALNQDEAEQMVDDWLNDDNSL